MSEIPSKDMITDVPFDDPAKVYNTCLELQELCEKEHGIGISAVQAGVPWRLFLVKGSGRCPLVPEGQYQYFVNCDYEKLTDSEQVVSLEGCLSLRSPDGRLRHFQVARQTKIRLFGFILKFDNSFDFVKVDDTIEIDQDGIVFQHEVDHSYGHERLISNIGQEVFVWHRSST